jgi:hypothetical protein
MLYELDTRSYEYSKKMLHKGFGLNVPTHRSASVWFGLVWFGPGLSQIGPVWPRFNKLGWSRYTVKEESA